MSNIRSDNSNEYIDIHNENKNHGENKDDDKNENHNENKNNDEQNNFKYIEKEVDFFNKANMYAEQKNYDLAEKYYIDIINKDRHAMNNLAIMYVEQRNMI